MVFTCYIPEHVVVQHILPHIHNDLSIDTRLHFGMKPRKIKINESMHKMLNNVIAKRVMWLEEDPELATDIRNEIPESGVCELTGHKYDIIHFHVRICWFSEDSTMSITFTKMYSASTTIIPRKYSARAIAEYEIINDCHTGQQYRAKVWTLNQLVG